MSQREIETRCALSQTMVSRAERGDALLPRDAVERWLTATAAGADVRDRILALHEAAHVETRPWGDLREAGHMQGIAAGDESAASRMRCYVTTMIPGLLQTAEYTRTLMPLVDPDGDTAAAVASRVARQHVLYQPDREFRFLLAESALWWAPARDVMAAQRDRLLSLSTLESVDLAVLPAHRVGPVGWHDFILWESPTGQGWVTVEMVHGLARVADPEFVALYEALWARLWASAATGDDAVELIRSSAT
jgi:hypothetical protein